MVLFVLVWNLFYFNSAFDSNCVNVFPGRDTNDEPYFRRCYSKTIYNTSQWAGHGFIYEGGSWTVSQGIVGVLLVMEIEATTDLASKREWTERIDGHVVDKTTLKV